MNFGAHQKVQRGLTGLTLRLQRRRQSQTKRSRLTDSCQQGLAGCSRVEVALAVYHWAIAPAP